MYSKIHKLISTWPPGAIRAVSALKREGYSQPLLNGYRKSNWLTSVGDNAVYRTGDKFSVLGGIYALQNDLGLKVHIGSRSALELQGFAHYIRNDKAPLVCCGYEPRLPKWFITYKWNQKIKYHSTKLFPSNFTEGYTSHKEPGFEIYISNPARALAEYLQSVPSEGSLEEAKELMKGLNALRPDKIQNLLEACTSVKVKRLFLLLAEECSHRWLGRVNLDSINLGVGPRNLTPGGVMHKRYRITVPRSVLSHEGT